MASSAVAVPRICGDGVVVVKAELGQAVEIVVENGVGDLVRSGDPSTIRVEHTSGHLFLTPLAPSPAEVSIIDRRGGSHLIRLVLDPPAEQRVVLADCHEDERAGGAQDPAIALMRDLIRGLVPVGSTEKTTDTVMFDDGKVRMRAILVEEMPGLTGNVLWAENLTSEPLIIPLQQMAYPGLLAVSAAQDVLAPGEKTKVYMVAGR